MADQSRTPKILKRALGYIGEPPISKDIGIALAQNFHYLNCWQQAGQIFTYTAPALDPDHGDQSGSGLTYVDGDYYIILYSPPKIDTAHPTRCLQGAFLPWSRYTDHAHDGTFDAHPTITWTPSGGAAQTLYESYGDDNTESVNLAADKRLSWGDLKLLGGRAVFTWTPDAAGGFTYGKLSTREIRTASLTVWEGPDTTLTDTQAQFDLAKLAPGHAIRGYTTTASLNSLGNLVERLGRSSLTYDGIWQTGKRRCLFQWGHPVGVWSDYAGYRYLPDVTTTTYKIPKRPLYNASYSAATYDATVAIGVSSVAKAAPPSGTAYVKIESTTGADTLIFEITSEAFQVASGDLTVASAGDTFKVSIMAHADREILLHTISIWDKAAH